MANFLYQPSTTLACWRQLTWPLFWFEQGNYKQASNILAQCDSKPCYQLQDKETADDLSSYF